MVHRQLPKLRRKINQDLQPIFTSKKTIDELRITELKPPLVNQQSEVYEFKCDLCNTKYIGYMCGRLHQLVDEHKDSVIGKHFENQMNIILSANFKSRKKCWSKLEMLLIWKKRPKLNTQPDSICTNSIISLFTFL